MTDKKIGIGVVVDASEAQDGFKRVGDASREMANIVKQSGNEAGKGLDGVGAGGDAAAAKLDRATKSIIGSIQRTTTQLEAGGKASSKYYELLASQRNVNVDALKPYIDQLKAVEGAQTKVGVSAAQTSAAMRNVPAQFTDIITSLQGGQQPLTVFLQQGGQLKDMFGGIAPAAKALGGYIVGLINPFTLAAAALGGLGYVYAQADERAREFSKSIILSGNAAGTSADQLLDITRRISDAGNGSRASVAEALNALVVSGNVSAQVIDRATQAAIKGQKYLGISIEDNAKAFADLGKDPSKTLDSLNSKYNFLTLEIYKQVKALEDQGRSTEAAKVAQNAFADAIESRSESVKKTLTGWAALWNDIKEAASGAGDAVARAFDAPTLTEEMGKLSAQRGQLVSALQDAQENGNKDRVAQIEKELKANFSLLQLYSEKEASIERQTAAQLKQNEAEKAKVEFEKIREKNLDKQSKLELEIARIRAVGATAGLKSKEIEDQVAIARKNGAEKAQDAVKKLTREQEIYGASMKAIGDAEKKNRKELEDSFAAYADTVKKHTKDIVSGFNEQWQAENRLKSSLDDWARGYRESAELAQLELSLLGQSAVERNTALAQYKIELDLQTQIRAIEKERAAGKISKAGSDEAILKANQNAADAKNLAGIKAQQEEWSKFYADIYNGLSDSLYRGFEAGKGFFQNFWDGVKNLFKTTVLKLAVQGVMTGVLGGIAGTAGAATLPAAISSGANLLTIGKSIYDGFSLAASTGAGVAAIGNLLGASAISAFGAGMGLSSSAATAAAGVYSAAGMGTTASAISAGSIVGTALPWVAGAALLYKGLSMGDKQLAGQTITGNLGTQDLMRNVSWTQSGGFLRKDRSGVWSYGLKDSTAIQDGKAYQDTANVANDSAMLKYLNDSYAAVKEATQGFAKTLGLNADEIAKRNDAINVTLGKTKEETDAAIQKALGGIADSIAASLLPNFKDLAKEGETASGTLARVAASFGGVNKTLGDLGLKLFQVNDAGIKASSSFVDLFGGLDQLNSVGASYYENFYSQQERTATALKTIGAEFEKLSLGILPTSREQYRALVEEISKTGSAEQLAAVLKLSNAFASVVPASEALTAAIDDTSAAAKKAADTLAERARLQDEYDNLTLTAGELLAKQRAALFESNQALFDSIQAIKAKKEAEQEATKAAEEAAAQRATQAAQAVEEMNRYAAALKAQKAALRQAAIDQGLATVAGAQLAKPVAGLESAYGSKTILALFGLDENGLQAPKAQADLLAKVVGSALQKMIDRAEALTDVIAGGNGVGKYISTFATDMLGLSEIFKISSENALKIRNVGGAFGNIREAALGSKFYEDKNAQLLAQGANVSAIGLYSGARELAAAAAKKYALEYMEGGAGGVAGILAADRDLEALRETTKLYFGTVNNLEAELKSGRLSAEEYTEALKFSRDMTELAGGALDDLSYAQKQRSIASEKEAAAVRSAIFYFDKLSDGVAELDKVAKATNAPILQLAETVDRMKSAAFVFAKSAASIGATPEDQTTKAVSQAIAKVAEDSAKWLNTRGGKAIQDQFANNPIFNGVDLQKIAPMLDSVNAWDIAGYEESFLRLSDALANGSLNVEQYGILMGVAKDKFNDVGAGMSDALAGAVKGLKEFKASLMQDYATNISPQASYEQAVAALNTATAENVQGLVKTFLDASKNSATSLTDYLTSVDKGIQSVDRFIPGAGGGDPVVDAVKDLKAEVVALKAELQAIKANTEATATHAYNIKANQEDALYNSTNGGV